MLKHIHEDSPRGPAQTVAPRSKVHTNGDVRRRKKKTHTSRIRQLGGGVPVGHGCTGGSRVRSLRGHRQSGTVANAQWRSRVQLVHGAPTEHSSPNWAEQIFRAPAEASSTFAKFQVMLEPRHSARDTVATEPRTHIAAVGHMTHNGVSLHSFLLHGASATKAAGSNTDTAPCWHGHGAGDVATQHSQGSALAASASGTVAPWQ